MRLILVRHGQTAANIDRALDTAAPGAPLTPLGHEQAEAVAEVLMREDVVGIFSSHLTRTIQTASPLARRLGLAPVVLPGIREIRAAELEMRSDLPSVLEYHRTVDAWAHGTIDIRMRGGESGREVFARFNASIEVARSAVGDGVAVFFSHGAIIRTWAGYHARNVDAAFATGRVVVNTGIVILDSDGAGWMVRRWMDESF